MMNNCQPVILALLLNMDDEHLLEPKCQLRKKVELHDSANLAAGPAGPELGHVEIVGRGIPDVLPMSVRWLY